MHLPRSGAERGSGSLSSPRPTRDLGRLGWGRPPAQRADAHPIEGRGPGPSPSQGSSVLPGSHRSCSRCAGALAPRRPSSGPRGRSDSPSQLEAAAIMSSTAVRSGLGATNGREAGSRDPRPSRRRRGPSRTSRRCRWSAARSSRIGEVDPPRDRHRRAASGSTGGDEEGRLECRHCPTRRRSGAAPSTRRFPWTWGSRVGRWTARPPAGPGLVGLPGPAGRRWDHRRRTR